MKNSILVTSVIVVLVAALAFFGGMKYQESRQSTLSRQTRGQFVQRAGGGNRAGLHPVNGEILSQDDTSITVKLNDGTSKIVILTDKTQFNKADTATKQDMKVGDKVAVFGQDNSDGSVTAQNIQIRAGVNKN